LNVWTQAETEANQVVETVFIWLSVGTAKVFHRKLESTSVQSILNINQTAQLDVWEFRAAQLNDKKTCHAGVVVVMVISVSVQVVDVVVKEVFEVYCWDNAGAVALDARVFRLAADNVSLLLTYTAEGVVSLRLGLVGCRALIAK